MINSNHDPCSTLTSRPSRADRASASSTRSVRTDSSPDGTGSLKTWPKVVGIISIIWAALGLACNACGVFMPQLMTRMLPEEMTKGPMPPNMNPGIEMYVLMAVGMAVTLVLFVGGIALVRRKRSARAMHLVWALLACILAAIGLFMQWRIHGEMQAWIQQNPDSPWAQQQKGQQGDIGLVIGLLMGAVFGFAYPVFCLIWFGLVKRNPAEIDSGVEDSVV